MPNCYYYDEQRNRCNCYVNKNLDELLADNAKLREELDAAKHDLSLFSERIVELGADNAKLSELVDYMTPIAFYGASEQERDRMRELGVEVDT